MQRFQLSHFYPRFLKLFHISRTHLCFKNLQNGGDKGFGNRAKQSRLLDVQVVQNPYHHKRGTPIHLLGNDIPCFPPVLSIKIMISTKIFYCLISCSCLSIVPFQLSRILFNFFKSFKNCFDQNVCSVPQ